MKVLSAERQGLNSIAYWIEDKGQYIEQVITSDNQIEDWSSVPTSKYKGYKNFADVMGKFSPYEIFMIKPIVIDKLDFETMLGVVNEFERVLRGGDTNIK